MHEADEKEIITGNSDSGVHTENATPSPGASASPVHADEIPIECFDMSEDAKSVYAIAIAGGSRRKPISDREAKLLKEHECRREFCDGKQTMADDVAATVSQPTTEHMSEDNVAGQIELLEKVVAINKHIQREEELLVRLNAKIRKYEADNPALTETEIIAALDRVNDDIASTNSEMVKMGHELDTSNEMLVVKADIVDQLSRELAALELLAGGGPCEIDASNLVQIHTEPQSRPVVMDNGAGPSRISTRKTIPAPNSAATDGRDNVLSEQINYYKNMLPSPNLFAGASTSAQQPYIVPDHVILSQAPRFFQKDDGDADTVNSLHFRTDQRNINSNVATMAKCVKIGPKKLMNGLCKDQDSDTGISSLGEDGSQLGTLV